MSRLPTPTTHKIVPVLPRRTRMIMTRTLHWIAATAFAALSITPALAAGTSPVGNWQVTTGEARYTVTSCGGGQQLCAKLTWLRSDARTENNLALLNHY